MKVKVNYEPEEQELGIGIVRDNLITLHCEEYFY